MSRIIDAVGVDEFIKRVRELCDELARDQPMEYGGFDWSDLDAESFVMTRLDLFGDKEAMSLVRSIVWAWGIEKGYWNADKEASLD